VFSHSEKRFSDEKKLNKIGCKNDDFVRYLEMISIMLHSKGTDSAGFPKKGFAFSSKNLSKKNRFLAAKTANNNVIS